jgi:hypothetical protein
MGVKYTRDYEDIIKELTEVICKIDNFYEFFDMTSEDWSNIPEDEKKECAETLADDIFYALGNEQVLTVGKGEVKHDNIKNNIIISYDENNIVISL